MIATSPLRDRAAGRLARAALALALLVVVAAGCGSSETLPTPSPRTGGGDGSPASGSPAVSVADPLAAFEGRLRDATTREGALVRALAAASAGDPAKMRLAVTQMREWIHAEQAWLTAAPVQECFAAAVVKYEAAVAAMTKAADGFAATATGSPTPSDEAVGAAAGQSLQDAARALADTAVLAKDARPNCR
jgi:hypothetical protein